jgi:hypothetical protein
VDAQVGIATALVELVALGLCLVSDRPRAVRRALGSIAYVFVVVVVGGFVWGGALARHSAGGAGLVGAGSAHPGHKGYGRDGRVLDPDRPEQLMYAIADGRATLLSAVYVMPSAGTPAPAPGGPITQWHSHNVCVTALPPGFALVDAYGGCPPFAVKLALPLMMHVWVVDNPGGPFADGVPGAWAGPFNRAHGVPFSW